MQEETMLGLRLECRAIEHPCSGYVRELERRLAERSNEIRRIEKRLQAASLFLHPKISDFKACGEIIGESPAILGVVAQIERVARTDANVLIQGESGTGKELVAREIHKRSRRSRRPLIKVNCAAIPKDLYESEFFGHVKGAFTGAVYDRIGRFEAADGATLFLDEVGEIPINLQSKMLGVLQDGEFERVGDGVTRRADVRIIAATNKNLKAEIEAKRFRDDLFYRLNVFPIEIPPLRDRKDDIRLLVIHLVRKLSKKMNMPEPRLSMANIQDLMRYDWPGNVRELENVVERALILSRSGRMHFMLTSQHEAPDTAAALEPSPGRADVGNAVLTAKALKALERRNTLEALRRCRWKIYGEDGASRLLGLKPTTLIERMKRMKIARPK